MSETETKSEWPLDSQPASAFDVQLPSADKYVVEIAGIAADATASFLGGTDYQRTLSNSRPVDLSAWYAGYQPPDGREPEDVHFLLATFVRQNPTAPIEALYRYAQGQGVHDRPADEWHTASLWLRQGYETFARTVLQLDAAIAAERAALLTKAVADRKPPLATAYMVDPEDTILQQLPDPLEVRKDVALGIVKAPVKSEASPAPEPQPDLQEPLTPEPSSQEPAATEPSGQAEPSAETKTKKKKH